uniref:Uncharacterized protein n=4 Tax=environmental samples TaxID=68359 RepID=A0A075G1W5_9EURY|nr:hypothetical protein [uncultured marine group II/III euryarchaeote KM3_01_B07]AIF09567.1 hypothetical protein [uncultured marine group II/III euryarchaeote KM3_37_G11]AIF17472.1 hypothetical protein [uncultured marine group II/III euryarchaeote KM3_77_F03]
MMVDSFTIGIDCHRVDGEVTASQVILDAASENDLVWPPAIPVGAFAAQGCDLPTWLTYNTLIQPHYNGSVLLSNHQRARKELLDLGREQTGGDIEVGFRTTNYRVPDPASYNPSLTGGAQSGEDLRIGFAEVLQRALHGAPTDYLP